MSLTSLGPGHDPAFATWRTSTTIKACVMHEAAGLDPCWSLREVDPAVTRQGVSPDRHATDHEGLGLAAMKPANTLETRVHDFLAQKRIAVAGVSRDNSQHPIGNLVFHRLKMTGHDVFPVNPHLQTFEGERCYPDLQSIPGGVDGVVIVTRPETTERIVRNCGDAGVRRVWMHQSTGKGSSVSPEAVEYCRQHDISVIAGACPMMYGPGADFGHTCMRWILGLTGRLERAEGAPRQEGGNG